MNQPDPELMQQLNTTTIFFTVVVLVAVGYGFWTFVKWQKRDIAKREREAKERE